MKKYLAILLTLIIGITGFFVYDNYFKPWKEAEERINKYMVEQVIRASFIRYLIKMILNMNMNIFIAMIFMLYI